MNYKEMDFTPTDMIAPFLNVIAYIISPILFIWAVNTLFDCGIPITFKTWLAGFVLIMLLKFHLKTSGDFSDNIYEDYDDDDDEDGYDDDDDNDDRDIEERKAKLKAKLMAYQEHKDKKNPPSDES
jgi:hypothetical protein